MNGNQYKFSKGSIDKFIEQYKENNKSDKRVIETQYTNCGSNMCVAEGREDYIKIEVNSRTYNTGVTKEKFNIASYLMVCHEICHVDYMDSSKIFSRFKDILIKPWIGVDGKYKIRLACALAETRSDLFGEQECIKAGYPVDKLVAEAFYSVTRQDNEDSEDAEVRQDAINHAYLCGYPDARTRMYILERYDKLTKDAVEVVVFNFNRTMEAKTGKRLTTADVDEVIKAYGFDVAD